jgi:hypothetical protein
MRGSLSQTIRVRLSPTGLGCFASARRADALVAISSARIAARYRAGPLPGEGSNEVDVLSLAASG